MENKKSTNELFRLAFAHLRTTRHGTLKEIADACGCTDRHLSNVLNKGIGSSPDIKQRVAEFYATTIDDMLVMGREISEGRLPTQQVSMRDANHSKVVNTNATDVGNIHVSIGSDQDEYTVKLSKREYEVFAAYCDLKRPEMLLDACLERMRRIKGLAGIG